MTDRTVAHPDTGEVLDDAAARELGRALVAIKHSIDEAFAEARRLQDLAAPIRHALIEYLGVNNALTIDDQRTVAVLPGAAGRKSVDRVAAQRHAEQLADLGLGKTETTYKAPTVAELNKNRAQVVAAGIPWDDLVLEGTPGPATIEIVERDGDA